MDEKFRLVFACPEQTPSAEAYVGKDAIVCDRLRDAIKLGSETNMIWGVPFIAHKITVLVPTMIDLIYQELFADPPVSRSSLSRKSS